jgi:hypothetical protein
LVCEVKNLIKDDWEITPFASYRFVGRHLETDDFPRPDGVSGKSDLKRSGNRRKKIYSTRLYGPT